MDDFQYDVALSFLAQDEPIATQLANKLEDRLRVFLYSRRQEQLAGTDGEVSFTDVFSKQARLVVVLYRQGWGESPWTRIEQTAIKNRAFDQGYNFALFVPLDDKPTMPPWVPKTQLWIGLSRFGVDGAASVIDARVQELGGAPKVETLEELASRIDRTATYQAFRETYRRSYEGVRDADSSYDQILQYIEDRVPSLQTSGPALGLQVKRQNRILIVIGTGPCLRLEWHRPYTNSLDEAYVNATIWQGHPPFQGSFDIRRERHPVASIEITPDISELHTFSWVVPKPSGKTLLDSISTAEHILTWWLDKTAKNQRQH